MALSAKEKLEKLLELISKEEERRTDFSTKCFEKNNLHGMIIHSAEAGMCTKARYIIEDLLYEEENIGMEFNEAYTLMKAGSKIKMPEWGGYWYWSEEKNTIIIHTKDGNEIDIRDTENVGYTFDFICRNDWIVVKE
jgi:hypothetical protein